MVAAALMAPLALFSEIEFIDGGPAGIVHLRDTNKTGNTDYFINANQIISVEVHAQAPELKPVARLILFTTQIRAVARGSQYVNESVSYSILFPTRKEADAIAAKMAARIPQAEPVARTDVPAEKVAEVDDESAGRAVDPSAIDKLLNAPAFAAPQRAKSSRRNFSSQRITTDQVTAHLLNMGGDGAITIILGKGFPPAVEALVCLYLDID